MTKPSIAMVAKEATNFPGFMIMIYYQRAAVSTNDTLFGFGLNLKQVMVRNYVSELASIYSVSIRRTTCPTPTVKTIPLFVVRREKLRRCRFHISASSAVQQFHAFNDNALRVGRPFSSFIGPGIPDILAQNDLRLAASFLVFGFGAGGFSPGLPGLARL
jgi:hypothetical protein